MQSYLVSFHRLALLIALAVSMTALSACPFDSVPPEPDLAPEPFEPDVIPAVEFALSDQEQCAVDLFSERNLGQPYGDCAYCHWSQGPEARGLSWGASDIYDNQSWAYAAILLLRQEPIVLPDEHPLASHFNDGHAEDAYNADAAQVMAEYLRELQPGGKCPQNCGDQPTQETSFQDFIQRDIASVMTPCASCHAGDPSQTFAPVGGPTTAGWHLGMRLFVERTHAPISASHPLVQHFLDAHEGSQIDRTGARAAMQWLQVAYPLACAPASGANASDAGTAP